MIRRLSRIVTFAPLYLLAALMLFASAAQAQRADSARFAARPRSVDTLTKERPRSPLSPRRAFLYSLALPGYSQSRLGRPTAGAIFVLTESIAVAMLRESIAALRTAQRFRTDSLIFLGDDPVTGTPVMQRAPFSDDLLDIRKGHIEDWVAFMLLNHLFAGADGYVAAHLWDLPSQISVRPTSNGTLVAVSLRW